MIRPGEIYWADLDAGRHKVVVVSREELNRGTKVLVALITSQRFELRSALPNCVPLRAGEFGMDSDFPSYDRQPQYQGNREREQREPRENREPRESRDQREPRRERDREPAEPTPVDFTPGVEGEPIEDAPAENPFVRDNRAARGLRPRTERRPRREQAEDGPATFAPASLPPSLGPRAEAESEAPAAEEAPAPRKRGRPRKVAAPEAGEAPEAVNG